MAVFKTANTKDKYYEPSAKETVIEYILNPQKAMHYYGGYGVDCSNPAQSMTAISEKFNKTSGVQLRHFIVAFYPYELSNPAIANEIAQKLIGFFASEYQVIHAVHEDKPHLHIHIVINSVSYIDGHRYKGTRLEFNNMKNYWSLILRQYGMTLIYSPNNRSV